MRRTKGILCALAVWSVIGVLPGQSRDLPFAPPRSKQKVAPVIFSPFEHEAIMARLEFGWTQAENINEEKKVRIMQFFGPGTDEDNLKQMINVVSYLDLSAKESAREFMERAHKESVKMVPKDKLHWNTVSDVNPNDVIFSLAIKGWIDSPDQYEVERVVHGQDGMHAFIYHFSNPEPSDDESAKALAWVKSVRIDHKEATAEQSADGKKVSARPQGLQAASPDSAKAEKK